MLAQVLLESLLLVLGSATTRRTVTMRPPKAPATQHTAGEDRTDPQRRRKETLHRTQAPNAVLPAKMQTTYAQSCACHKIAPTQYYPTRAATTRTRNRYYACQRRCCPCYRCYYPYSPIPTSHPLQLPILQSPIPCSYPSLSPSHLCLTVAYPLKVPVEHYLNVISCYFSQRDI